MVKIIVIAIKFILALLFPIILLASALFAATLNDGNHYFKAKWCGPCKKQSAIIEQLIEEGYNFTIYDADDNPEAFKNHNINAMPTIIINKKRLEGTQSKKKLIRLLDA